MKTSRTLIAVAVAALIPLGAAVAGDKDKDMNKSGYGGSFDTLDTNRDGKISQAEAGSDTTIVFSTADANGDGYLDKSEWKNRSKSMNPGTGSDTNPGTSTNPSTSPTPQSSSESTSDPTVPPADQSASEPTTDTETPRQ